MKYDNLLIIYYSGTGNSARVSAWIGEVAENEGMKVIVTSFDKFNPDSVKDFKGRTLIGFFSATHGFNMPHSMLKFILRFSMLKRSDVFIGNTRAGMKLSKLFLPGLSGIALYLPALIMLLKGYKVISLYPVDLPSNWISLHPGLNPKVIDSMFSHYKNLTVKYAEKVLSRKKVFLKAFILLPLDILVLPLAVGYYFFGRFIIAKTFITNKNCDNCGLCINQCTTNSIKLSDGRPFWKLSCESCMKCMNYCPKRAIETAHTYFFLILFATILFVNPPVTEFVTRLTENISGIAVSGILTKIIRWTVTVAIFACTYRLIHYLCRFPFFSRIIQLTSFTHWKFWRRYKAKKIT